MRTMGPNASRARLTADTDPAAEQVQIETWRGMTIEQRAQVTIGASRSARRLAFAGLRARYPHATESELVARYAELTLGRTLARKAYPQLDLLAPDSPG